MTKPAAQTLDQQMQQIALDHLFIETLEPATATGWISMRSASGASRAP